jgi:tryptophanyl-tRNA synthetase
MTQFKDKSARGSGEFVSAGLLTYPTLMAADIVLYDTNRVPVGDDQRQHIELARDVAIRFNSRYGETFVVPEAAIPRTGARVMDLQEPRNKMSKSVDSPQGTVMVLDPPEVIERKLSRAVTDSDSEVRFDPADKPGVSNLLSILAASTGESVEMLAGRYTQYGPLKKDTAAALIEALRPVRERYESLAADPAAMTDVLRKGASKAREVASVTYERARTAIGLLES